MTRNKRTAAGEAVTDLILEVFRLNGCLLVAGDRLVAGLGLTSARWQVLGAISLGERPEPVAWIARSMGLNRQGVQRIVNDLLGEGLVKLEPNPNHRRAQLVVLTRRGKDAVEAAERLQTPWVDHLAKGLSRADIVAATRLLEILRKRQQAELNIGSERCD